MQKHKEYIRNLFLTLITVIVYASGVQFLTVLQSLPLRAQRLPDPQAGFFHASHIFSGYTLLVRVQNVFQQNTMLQFLRLFLYAPIVNYFWLLLETGRAKARSSLTA